jgi:3-phenylpropionate/cinnamic acid dioxygenase small subunit
MASLTAEDAAQFLYREARLLDERRYDEWLALFTGDGLYWAPTEDDAGPYDKVSLIHDDTLRREERVFRITRTAPPAQSPASRTLHVVANVEVENGGDEARVHSSQIVYEMRAGGGNYRYLELGEPRSFAIRCEHVLRPDGGAWRIALKKMLLLNRDVPIGNLTFIL